jgi:hypothetical protein
MFVITLGDIFGLTVLAIVLVIAAIYGGFTMLERWLCKHDWRFIDPAFGNKFWRCNRCGKKHDDLDKPQ